MGCAIGSVQSIPRGVGEPAHAETFSDRNLGGPGTVPRVCRYSRARIEGVNSAGVMRGATGNSDRGIVPMKQTNKAADPAAESAEGRPLTKRNSGEYVGDRTQSRVTTTSGLAAVREAARADPALVFTKLLTHLTPELLWRSFYALDRNAAPGPDGVRWEVYCEGLEHRLQDLCRRVHQGRYRPSPARRVTIPKEDGSERTLGILCTEDKVVQQAVREILSQIYEVDFRGFSYGFRPGRSQHDALDALAVGITRRKVNWVLDLDIRKFFDRVEHDWVLNFLQHRVGDPRVTRLVRQWLQVGHLDDNGRRIPSGRGTPQGAVISPLLANLYLHYVYDLWVDQWRRRHAHGDMIVVRYADDSVLGFQHGWEAEAFRRDLETRVATFGLSLHPEKTRLIRFGRFAAKRARSKGKGKPATFDFLGFTHVCGESLKGHFALRRRTMRKRQVAQLRRIREELRRRLHHAVEQTGSWLRRVVMGHINYYGVPLNSASVASFCQEVRKSWYRALCRRSQRKRLNWARFMRIAGYWLPPARVVHPYPQERFDATTRGRSRMR